MHGRFPFAPLLFALLLGLIAAFAACDSADPAADPAVAEAPLADARACPAYDRDGNLKPRCADDPPPDTSSAFPITEGAYTLYRTDLCEASGRSEADCITRFQNKPAKYCDQQYPGDCEDGTPPPTGIRVPLIDMVAPYLGQFEGGLYGSYSNFAPVDHRNAGLAAAAQIQPLDANGQPDPNGIIGVGIPGMSNVIQEICNVAAPSLNPNSPAACNPWTLIGRDMAGLRDQTVLIPMARGGQANGAWASPDSPEYQRVNSDILPYYGVNRLQVQVVWIKAALQRSDFPGARPSLPDPNADAYVNEAVLADHVRALLVHYPNIKVVLVSSRINADGADPQSNSPEPYAHESGFAAKWFIDAQIEQRRTGQIDAQTGDVLTGFPFVDWGPYLWSYSDRPRSDGLQWSSTYYQGDGVHPNGMGEEVVSDYLEAFLRSSPYTAVLFD